METITEKDEEFLLISDETDLKEVIDFLTSGKQFANQFKFSKRSYFTTLLESLSISEDEFSIKYYYYDPARKLHITESEFGYIWISTYGLIAKNKATTNRAVNACLNQHIVISMLIDKAIEVTKDDRVYDVDSYNFSLLSKLSPAIFHNLTFYIEVFCKAYLSLTGVEVPHSHKLALIYQKTVDTIIGKKHENSLFQISVLEPLYKFVDHITNLPGGFKEHNIKYDYNMQDDTIILFDSVGLFEMSCLLELSLDFINGYYYDGASTYYLKSNVYQMMMDRADTESKKKRIQDLYPHLANKYRNIQ